MSEDYSNDNSDNEKDNSLSGSSEPEKKDSDSGKEEKSPEDVRRNEVRKRIY